MSKNTPINKNNFLRFYPVSQNTEKSIVNGYAYKWKHFSTPLPILVGDTFYLYTNFKEDVISTNTIKIVENYDTIVEDVTKYDITTTDIGNYNKLITLTIPLTNTSSYKNFSLGIISGSTIVSLSNTLCVMQRNEQNLNGTHMLSFKNTTNTFNYEWDGEILERYTVRVPSNMIDFSYPKEDAVYKSATTGRPRKTRTVLSKAYLFEAYYLDESGHDAINYCLNSNEFYINNIEFVIDGGYDITFNRNTNIHKGTATILEKEYGSMLNIC